MLKNRIDLNHISKILFKIFKKLHRFKFNSKNLYIFLLFMLLFSFKKGFYLEEKNEIIVRNKKYYYYLYFIFFKQVLKNFAAFKKINNNLDLDRLRLSLDHKNQMNFIYLENFDSETNRLKKIEYDFFFKFKKFFIYLEEDYKFRIDVFDFLFYGKYIEYIRKSIYNEYLTFTATLFDYPLLKTFFRSIIYVRLSKIQDNDLNFLSNYAILKKYHIYDDFDSIKVMRSKKILVNYSSISLINNLVNTNLIKCLMIWKNKKFYNYLDQLLNKFFKSNIILPAYYINLNYEEEDDITDTNKLNMMGLYSLYWQMNRYGFKFNYYYYLNSLVSSLENNSLNKIVSYNIYFLKFILSANSNNYWVFWYKLMNLILLDFIYNTFFKFFKFNKLNLKRKKLRFKRLLSFKFLMQTYSFIFLPLDMESYYNNLHLVKNLDLVKFNLDNLLVNIFFGYNLNLSEDLNFNMKNIHKKIDLDNLLYGNIDYYINIFFFFLSKKIGKFFFINFFSQFKGLNFFLVRILDSWNLLKNSSHYYLTRDNLDLVAFKYLDFNLSKHRGINYFYSYRHRFLDEYLWDFEFVMIYSFYLIVLYKYNQLYLKIFIGKFLLFGNK